MKKYILSILFICCAIFASADELPTINITYSGTTATVDIPTEITDVTSTVSGATVVINSSTINTEYCYKVSGYTSNGSLSIGGSYKLTLELAGINLTSATGAAINIACGKRIAVIVDEGTTNTLTDCSNGTQKAALYFTGHPEFEGSGTLNVTGKTGHAISAKEYLELKDDVGTINILGAVKDGIHCGKGKANNENNYFLMKGGTVNINNVLGDCIDSDDYGVIKIKGGEINMTVIEDGGRGIKCDSTFTMEGGTINAILNGGTLIEANDTSRCMAVNTGVDMIMSGGEINISRTNSESKAYKVKGIMDISNDAKIIIDGNYYSITHNDYEYDMTAYVAVKLNGFSLDDYSNYHIAAYSGKECRGNAIINIVKGNATYAYLRIYGNIISDESIAFRIYDASTKKEFVANETISFVSDGQQNEPSDPFILTINSYDVNMDGDIDIEDISALVSYLNDKTPAKFDTSAADVNNDGRITIADVDKMCHIILGK